MARPTPVPDLGPDSPVGDAAFRLVATRLSDVRRYEALVASARDPHGVHDMRIAIRRLRAALALFAHGKLARAERKVKRLQDALGGVRDLDVLLARLAELERTLRAEAPEPARAVTLMAERLRARMPRAEKQLSRALERWERRTAPRLLDRLGEVRQRGTLSGKRMRRRLGRLASQVERRIDAALASPDPATAHALRIAVKRLRYLGELLAPAFPEAMARLADLMERMQDALGALHDADVLDELAVRLTRRVDVGDAAGAVALELHLAGVRRSLVTALAAELHGIRAQPLVVL